MASPILQSLGTFPFAIRTPDGRHAKVIGHFTPLEWPPSESAFDFSAADGGTSPVFVLTELGNPAVLPAMRLQEADRVEWLDNEASSAPARSAQSRQSILATPGLTAPDPATATHAGPSRRRSLQSLMRSKSDATRPAKRPTSGHSLSESFLPHSTRPESACTAEACRPTPTPIPKLAHKSSLEVPGKRHHSSHRSISSTPSSLVATLSNWTIRKRSSMKRRSGEDLNAHRPPSLVVNGRLTALPSPGLSSSSSPHGDPPARRSLRKRASMPAAWTQAVPIEQKSQNLAPPASPSRHASSHSLSAE